MTSLRRLLIPAAALAALALPATRAAEAFAHQAIESDLQHFTDSSATALKPGVTTATLPAFQSALKSVAEAMLAGSYDRTHRAASYQAYPSPRELGETLKLGDGFSRFENITGMYLDAGPNTVLVGPTGGRPVALLVPDWMRMPPEGVEPTKDPAGWGLRRQRIPLKEGVNQIQLERAGLAYVDYFDDHAEDAPPVTVHFLTGRVNGFFDATLHTNADWDRLLDQAVAPVLDARGKHIQVAYPVEWFKTFTRSKGIELIQAYDTMLHHQYTFMGLVKYNKVPRNRILARVNHNYYMFRDGDGVAYLGNRGTMRMVADPAVVTKGDPCWGFNHEVGHVLQMRPQLTWGGLTEVSNNIMTMYTTTILGNPSRLKAQRNYQSARKNLIEANPRPSILAVDDVFDRLVPFWQLHLYFARNGKPDFYADVMEALRNKPAPGHGDDSIRNQFEFIKTCCEVAKLDLTAFFEQYGFFWTGELTVNDYRRYQFRITEDMVRETRQAIAAMNLPKPTEDISLIED